MGIEVLQPDINAGEMDFSVAEEGKVLFGLGAIKGVGTKAVEQLVKARKEGGPFRSVLDIFERTSQAVVTQGNVETLIKAGALDCLKARRSQLLAVLPRVAKEGQSTRQDKSRGQLSLFGSASSAVAVVEAGATSIALPDIPELPDAQRLAEEKKALGFYMTSHPLTRHATLLQALATHQVSDIPGLSDKAEVILGGMIGGLQVKNVQKSRDGGTRMGKMTFEDLSGAMPAMLWPSDFSKYESMLKEDFIGFLKGTISRRSDPAELVVTKVIPLDRGPTELSKGVMVRLHKISTQPNDIDRLLRMVRAYPGNLDLYLEVLGLEKIRRAIYKAGANLKIRHDERMLADLEIAFGADNIRLIGHRGSAGREESRQTLPSASLGSGSEMPIDEEEL